MKRFPTLKRYAMSVEDARALFGLASWPVSEEELKKKYRVLSLKHHPDRGGSTEEMQKVNRAAEALFKALEASDGKSHNFSKFHADIEKAVREYKDIDHSHNEDTAEIIGLEEQHKKLVDEGHVELAKLDASGAARLKVKLKGGGHVVLKVWKEKPSAYRSNEYFSKVESLSDDAPESAKQSLAIGKTFTGESARRDYYKAEKHRNFAKHIKDKKKSLSRQKAYSQEFEKKEEGVSSSGTYYTTEPSEAIVSGLVDHMLKTNVLRVLSRGKNKGSVSIDPSAVRDLGKSKDSNAKFIAGVVAMMRSYVDRRVTSNMMGVMDAGSLAEQIASMIVTGKDDYLRSYRNTELKDVPWYKEEGKDMHMFDGAGQHSDVFKKGHAEYLKNKEEIEKQSREIGQRMHGYAKLIGKVMIEKGLMQRALDEMADRLYRIADVLLE